MSFGFSPSDILTLIQLAKTTYEGCRKAPEHFGEAGRGAKSLHLVFQNLQSEVENPTSLLNRNEDCKSHIAEIANNCKVVLGQLDGIVRKHSSLGTSKVKALDRFRFPRKEILEIQGNLKLHESHLITYLQTIGVSALGRVEQKFEVVGKPHEQVMEGLARVLGAVDRLGAEIRVGMHPESQFSDHTDDEKEVWRILRRKLIHAGITSRFIQPFEDKIIARVKEMNQYRLLDSDARTETSEDGGFDTDTPLNSSVKIKATHQPPEAVTDTESGWDSEATLPPRPSKLEVRRKASCGTIMNQKRRRAASNSNHNLGSGLTIPSVVEDERSSDITNRHPGEDTMSAERTPRPTFPDHTQVIQLVSKEGKYPRPGHMSVNGIDTGKEIKLIDEGIAMENYNDSMLNTSPTQHIAELESNEARTSPMPSQECQSPGMMDSPLQSSRSHSTNPLDGFATPRNSTPPPIYSQNPEPRDALPLRDIQSLKPFGPIPDASIRIWTGVDSRLKLKAKFVKFDGIRVRLVESDGGETIIFALKLSQPDLDYMEGLREESVESEPEKIRAAVKTVGFEDPKDVKVKPTKLILARSEEDVDSETDRPKRPEIFSGTRSNWKPIWRYRRSSRTPRRQLGFNTNLLPAAAGSGHLATVKRLLEQGAFVDWDGEDRRDSETGKKWTAHTTTGLYRAAVKGHLDVVLLLLEHGANVETKAILKAVASNGNAAITRLLLEYGADTEKCSNSSDHCTPLHVASEQGHKAVVEALLDFGADIEALDNNNETPLYHAAMNNRGQIAKMLLREGAKTSVIAEDGQTALYKAGGRGYEDMVRALLSYGADPNQGRGVGGETVLYKAARKGLTEVVYLLLQYGANPNVPNDTKDWAAGSTLDTIIWLLRPEDSPRNAYGQCPLYTAAKQGHGEIVGMLLEHGAVVNARNKNGDTALYAAAGKAHKEVVSMLFKHGATLAPQEEVDIVTKLMDPNNQDSEAAKNVEAPKRMEIISMLLSRMSTKRILRGLETWRNGESIPGLDMIAETIRKLGG